MNSVLTSLKPCLCFLSTVSALWLLGCTHRPQWQPLAGETASEADGPEVRKAILRSEAEDNSPVRSEIDDVARYLAGYPGGRNSALSPFRERPEWALHTNNLNELWRRFDTLRRAPIESWAARELGRLRSPSVLFYPFSGPDYLYADTFFPGAQTYVLCGLESSELLPELTGLTDEERRAGLEGLYTALTSSLNFSFFITKDMRVDLQRTAFRGTLPIILVFLARSGHHIDSVQPVALNSSGAVVARSGDAGTPGFQIQFRPSGFGGQRTLYYFTTNLANGSFSGQSRFARFVRDLGLCVSFTKSASYLMHEGGFSSILDFVLAQSTAVLQDDSGLPLRAFDPAVWDVRHYGRYSGVLDIFTEYYQPDLAKAHAEDTEPLGFGIGYKHQQGQSAMILARRR